MNLRVSLIKLHLGHDICGAMNLLIKYIEELPKTTSGTSPKRRQHKTIIVITTLLSEALSFHLECLKFL